jgi:diguanylate cyclase (GGDEF)-like protein
MTPPTGPPRNGASPEGQDPLVSEQTIADAEQTASDADQTAADTDQTAADRDRQSSDRDRVLSDADQRASDRDQAIADTPAEDAAAAAAAREQQKLVARQRAETSAARAETATDRAETTFDRFEAAARRDDVAGARDLASDARDIAAGARDRLAGASEHGLAGSARKRAADDRGRAAEDRRHAATDRRQARADRDELQGALSEAHLDDLTGAYRRAMGRIALQDEIDRALRSDGLLVLAFVDVDGLKEHNDHGGHAAGDALLVDVVVSIRSKLRSYDPVVRFGGDEFVCALSHADLDDARNRFDQIKVALAESHQQGAISVGFAQLQAGDTLEDLTTRGDAALYEAKQRK